MITTTNTASVKLTGNVIREHVATSKGEILKANADERNTEHGQFYGSANLPQALE